MLVFVLILTAGYLLYLAWERYVNDKCRASFRCVIHVNGIRGKTSVCRLIDAHLRGGGFKVFTKTTGTSPRYIDVAGVEHALERRGPANIKEQLGVIRQARRQGAEILILECMAVQPELQRIAQERIVQGDVNVITNVRYDHTFELGGTLDEIAENLANTVPQNGVLFTADRTYFDFFAQKCKERGSKAILCAADGADGGEGLGENEAIAVAVGVHLGVPPERFPVHCQGYQADFGAYRLYQRPLLFLNLFSVNDPQSTLALLEKCGGTPEGRVFVYNHRADRLDRLELFIQYFFPKIPSSKIFIMGENKALARRLLRKAGYPAEIVTCWRDLLDLNAASEGDAMMLVGVGNIMGEATALIDYLEKESGHE